MMDAIRKVANMTLLIILLYFVAQLAADWSKN